MNHENWIIYPDVDYNIHEWKPKNMGFYWGKTGIPFNADSKTIKKILINALIKYITEYKHYYEMFNCKFIFNESLSQYLYYVVEDWIYAFEASGGFCIYNMEFLKDIVYDAVRDFDSNMYILK
jgi:hypothetical protein